MSLVAWYPLNGNVKNQGVLEGDLIQKTAPTYSNGKMGKGLAQGAFTWDATAARKILGGDELTIAFWWKNLSDSTDRNMIFGNDSERWFALFRYPTKNDLHWSWKYSDGTLGTLGVVTGLLPDNKWIHICIVYKNPQADLYVNGVFRQTLTNVYDNSKNTKDVTTQVIWPSVTRVMNDLRFYNHALSQKEIKELSLGLAAHYKLSSIGAENIITNGAGYTFSSSGAVTGSSSSKAFTTSVSNASSLEGKKITLSVDIEAKNVVANDESGGHRAGAEFNMTGTSGTIYVGAWQSFTTDELSVKKRLTGTGTIPAGWNGNFGEKNMYIQRLASGSVKLSNIKLEISDTATSYSPSVNELGLTNYGIEDCSGFNNHGTLQNNVLWDSSSARYDGSRTFSTGVIKNIPSTINTDTDAFTIAFWFKPTSAAAMALYNNRTIVGEGVSIFWINSYIRFDTGSSNHWEPAVTCATNAWNHVAVTYDKNNTIKKLFINGVLKSSTTSVGNTSTVNTVASIGQSSQGSEVGNNQLIGGLNDFRIYSTALSDADILTLYRNSGTIDNKGNLQIYELQDTSELIEYDNYFASHADVSGSTWKREIVDDKDSPTGKALKMTMTNVGTSTSNNGFYFSSNPWSSAKSKLVHGQQYVLSYYVKMNRAKTGYKMNVECASAQSQNTFNIDTNYKKISNVFTYSKNTTYGAITNYTLYELNDEIYIHSVKIEKYNATPKMSKKGLFKMDTLDEQKTEKIKMNKHGIIANSLQEK